MQLVFKKQNAVYFVISTNACIQPLVSSMYPLNEVAFIGVPNA